MEVDVNVYKVDGEIYVYVHSPGTYTIDREHVAVVWVSVIAWANLRIEDVALLTAPTRRPKPTKAQALTCIPARRLYDHAGIKLNTVVTVHLPPAFRNRNNANACT